MNDLHKPVQVTLPPADISLMLVKEVDEFAKDGRDWNKEFLPKDGRMYDLKPGSVLVDIDNIGGKRDNVRRKATPAVVLHDGTIVRFTGQAVTGRDWAIQLRSFVRSLLAKNTPERIAVGLRILVERHTEAAAKIEADIQNNQKAIAEQNVANDPFHVLNRDLANLNEKLIEAKLKAAKRTAEADLADKTAGTFKPAEIKRAAEMVDIAPFFEQIDKAKSFYAVVDILDRLFGPRLAAKIENLFEEERTADRKAGPPWADVRLSPCDVGFDPRTVERTVVLPEEFSSASFTADGLEYYIRGPKEQMIEAIKKAGFIVSK